MTRLEELAEKAKTAQREYDKAKIAEHKNGTIVATSDKDGFSWKCKAGSDQVVKHAVTTLKSAIKALDSAEDTDIDKLALAVGIMEVLNDLAKAEIRG